MRGVLSDVLGPWGVFLAWLWTGSLAEGEKCRYAGGLTIRLRTKPAFYSHWSSVENFSLTSKVLSLLQR